jgi:mannosyltransferase OCH1-like enzyme
MGRRNLYIFLLINLLFIAFLVNSVWTLLSLLVVDGLNDRISRAELPGPNSDVKARERVIPKIIHQTYINESIPAHWQEAQQSCIDLHEDYEYILWTDAKSREFVAAEFPWFLETFDGYQFPIQRADAIRYFVLAHFGGVYIDLDDVRILSSATIAFSSYLLFKNIPYRRLTHPQQGCRRRLDPLLTYSAWVRRTVPTGISNDVMGATPHHPFFLKVIDALPRYDRSWLLPYITVMGSTGPLFLSVIWRHYNNELPEVPDDSERIRILFPDEYNKNSWSFFSHHLGSSWHRADVRFILWMGSHWVFLTVMGFMLAGVLFFGAWWVYGRVLSKGAPKRMRGPGGMWRRLWRRRRGGSGTVKMDEHALPLLERRSSDLEGRERVE